MLEQRRLLSVSVVQGLEGATATGLSMPYLSRSSKHNESAALAYPHPVRPVGVFTPGRRLSKWGQVNPIYRTDTFRLRIRQTLNTTVKLLDLTADADIDLYREGQKQPLARSDKHGIGTEFISITLDPGTYYITVANKIRTVTADFRLSLSAAPLYSPGFIRGENLGGNGARLAWSDSNDAEAGFRLERWLNKSGKWKHVASAPADATAGMIHGLLPGYGYTFRVTATSALPGGEIATAPSEPFVVTTDAEGTTGWYQLSGLDDVQFDGDYDDSRAPELNTGDNIADGESYFIPVPFNLNDTDPDSTLDIDKDHQVDATTNVSKWVHADSWQAMVYQVVSGQVAIDEDPGQAKQIVTHRIGTGNDSHFQVDTVETLKQQRAKNDLSDSLGAVIAVDDNGGATKDSDYDDFYSVLTYQKLIADLDADIDHIGGIDDADEQQETDPGLALLRNSTPNGTAPAAAPMSQQLFATINAPSAYSSGLSFQVTTGGSNAVRLWVNNGDGTWTLKEGGTVDWTGDQPAPQVWIEGVATGSATVSLKATGGQTTTTEDQIKVSVGSIHVDWAPLNSPLDSNPNAGGGGGIFPGKQNPNDATDRTTVQVKVQLSDDQTAPTVYLQSFDVDDPSTTDVLIDNETKDTDNRGLKDLTPTPHGTFVDSSGTEVGRNTSVSVQNHQATATFRVTMQPGDNFRVVASTDSNFLTPLKAKQSDSVGSIVDGNGDKISASFMTPLLTVWRKLHVEVDSMQPGTIAENRASGTVLEATYDPVSKLTDIQIEDVDSDFDKNDQFKNGRIKIAGFSTLDVDHFDSYLLQDDVFVKGNYAEGADDVDGKTYDLYDDDMLVDTAGNVSYKTTLRDPNTSSLAPALAPTYVEPDLITNTSDSQIEFDRNLNGWFAEDNSRVIEDDRQYPTSVVSDAYIAVHLVSGFQPDHDRDFDPDTENGGTATLGESQESRLGSVIYQEVIREAEGTIDESLVVVHEIGHLIGPDHEDQYVMASIYNGSSKFADESLAKIRSKTY